MIINIRHLSKVQVDKSNVKIISLNTEKEKQIIGDKKKSTERNILFIYFYIHSIKANLIFNIFELKQCALSNNAIICNKINH